MSSPRWWATRPRPSCRPRAWRRAEPSWGRVIERKFLNCFHKMWNVTGFSSLKCLATQGFHMTTTYNIDIYFNWIFSIYKLNKYRNHCYGKGWWTESRIEIFTEDAGSLNCGCRQLMKYDVDKKRMLGQPPPASHHHRSGIAKLVISHMQPYTISSILPFIQYYKYNSLTYYQNLGSVPDWCDASKWWWEYSIGAVSSIFQQ